MAKQPKANAKSCCHPERSEGPLLDRKRVPGVGVRRFAQDDTQINFRANQNLPATGFFGSE